MVKPWLISMKERVKSRITVKQCDLLSEFYIKALLHSHQGGLHPWPLGDQENRAKLTSSCNYEQMRRDWQK